VHHSITWSSIKNENKELSNLMSRQPGAMKLESRLAPVECKEKESLRLLPHSVPNYQPETNHTHTIVMTARRFFFSSRYGGEQTPLSQARCVSALTKALASEKGQTRSSTGAAT
jgi:hypothetical protein